MDFDEVVVKESPGLCRCCLSEGCYKDLGTEYQWMGENEVYADMLLECFDIGISQHLEGPNGPNRLICEVCITRLRDACDFKKQVQESEKKFVDMIGRGTFRAKVADYEENMKSEPQHVQAEPLDVEYLESMDYGDDNEGDDGDEDTLGRSSADITVSSLPAKRGRGRPRKTEHKAPKHKAKGTKMDKDDRFKRQEIARKLVMKRRNIEYIILYSNVTPFLWHKGKFKCFYCTQGMQDPDTLREHTRNAHSEANVELVIYDRTTTNRNKDAAVKIDVKDISCKLCTKKVTDLEQLIHHLIIAHDADYDTGVSNCVLPFLLDKENPTCPTCNTKFVFFEYLLRHANKHHLSHNYICDVCGTSFQGENHLRMHNRYYHREGGYKCEHCDTSLATLSQKIVHEKNVHLVNLATCPQCPETFKSPYLKRLHLANVHGVEEMKVKCPYCPKVYPQESIMSRHMRRVHLREKNVKCDVCGDKFFGTYDLKLHMVRHNGEKKFVCSVCGKKFSKKSNLNNHSLTHTKDFICEICSKGFGNQANLKGHIKSKHPEYQIVESIEVQDVLAETIQNEFVQIEYLKEDAEEVLGSFETQYGEGTSDEAAIES